MVETKEGQWGSVTNYPLAHNAVYVVNNSTGTVLNPFTTYQGTGDPMDKNNAMRIGDQIFVKGLRIVAFLENALVRPKVYYRMMLIKCAKGDTIDRTTLFKGDSGNKMIDVVNTERFTIIWQKVFNIESSNGGPAAVDLAGQITSGTAAGQGARIIRAWIPGRKFGRNGVVQYENGSSTQTKFFDYRLVFVTYDWFGTPQDTNNVGRINELFTKLYYKDG